jgi:protein-glutamine gamma-glutamyltransferase
MNLAARRATRLRLRDIAATSAFAAVAISGALPAAVPVLFGGALVLSLAGLRPFARHPAWSVVTLLFAAVVLFGLAFRGPLDLVVSAVAFATLVTAQRMLSEPTATTDQQVLLASLLLMAGAAALTGDVWYALCLLSFGTFACLSLGMTVVEGPVERDEELPIAPVMRQVSVGVALALAGGIGFFIVFPRLSWNMAARRAGPGLFGGTTGMTDRVRLGGGGNIKTSARVVLRATIEPKPREERLERYWYGRHFDTFDGKEWQGTGKPGNPLPRVMLGDPTGATVQRIELLPAYDSRTLVGLEHPLIFGPASAVTTVGAATTMLLKVGSEEVRFADDANAYSYTVQSRAEVPVLEDDPEVLEALKRLPPQLDARVTALATQIAGGERGTTPVARKLEQWLRGNLEYTLDLPGDVGDPLADFLFVRKAGHCEHFATALAVMLRSAGIPARVVGGFFGGERVGNHYVVRAGDAHAWVEAYDPLKGWLTFDATPEDGRGSQPQALIARLVDAFERVEELWRARVIDYSLVDQWNFVRDLIRPPSSTQRRSEGDAAQSKLEVGAPTPWVVAGLAVSALVGLILHRLRRRPANHPAASFLLDLEKRLAAAKVQFRAGEDIEALPVRLEREHHRLAQPVRKATRRYLEARFGGRPLSKAERAQLLRAVHGA